MKRSIFIRAIQLAAALVLGATGITVARAGDACAGQVGCTEARTFTATVTNFRTSKQGANRLVTLTVRFANKTDKPLALGYVWDSGIIMDDQGNRYGVWGPGAVRGIGSITGTTFDAKFTLEPRESNDARFELLWKHAGNTVAGTMFDFDVAVRELVPVNAGQLKLGQEHALHFGSINEKAPGAAGGNDGKPMKPAPSTAAPAVQADPCAGAKNCFNAGTFVAEVQQLTPGQFAKGARHHTVQLNIRFRNISNAPIVLAYKSGTSGAMDNYGNKYFWGRAGTHDTSVQGIGYVAGRSADVQFTLDPGQSRTATFGVIRYNVNSAIGTSYQYDVVINELEVLPGQQVRSLRENSVGFTNLPAGTFKMAAQLPADLQGVADAAPAEGNEVAQKAIDLFNAIKKTDKSKAKN